MKHSSFRHFGRSILIIVSLLLAVLSGVSMARAADECGYKNDFQKYYPICLKEAFEKYPAELTNAFYFLSLDPKSNEVFQCAQGGVSESGVSRLVSFIHEDLSKKQNDLALKSLSPKVKSEMFASLDQCMEREEKLHMTALLAASAAYEPAVSTNPIDLGEKGKVPGYKPVDEFVFPNSGFRALLFMPDDPSAPPIIAFKGTDSKRAWQNNGLWMLPQMKQAQAEFNRWVEDIYAHQTNRQVMVTGHSLGGGLAQAVVAAMPEYHGDHLRVVTFDAPNTRDTVELYAKSQNINAEERIKQNAMKLNSTVKYRVEGDKVSLVGENLGGQTRTIRNEWGFLKPVESHLIETMVEKAKGNKSGLAASCAQVGGSDESILQTLSSAVSRAISFGLEKEIVTGDLPDRFEKDIDAFAAKGGTLAQYAAEYLETPNWDLTEDCLVDQMTSKKSPKCEFTSENLKDPDLRIRKFKAACFGNPGQGYLSDCDYLREAYEKTGQIEEATNIFSGACAAGRHRACENAGDYLFRRGKQEAARRAYESGCENGYRKACEKLKSLQAGENPGVDTKAVNEQRQLSEALNQAIKEGRDETVMQIAASRDQLDHVTRISAEDFVKLHDKKAMSALVAKKAFTDLNAAAEAVWNLKVREEGDFDLSDKIETLHKLGYDVNSRDSKGQTLLYKAIKEERFYEIQKLIELGADPTVANKNGESALSYAKRTSSRFLPLLNGNAKRKND